MKQTEPKLNPTDIQLANKKKQKKTFIPRRYRYRDTDCPPEC